MIFGVCFRCVFGESLVLDFVFWLGFFCGGLIVGCDDMTSFPSPFLLFAEIQPDLGIDNRSGPNSTLQIGKSGAHCYPASAAFHRRGGYSPAPASGRVL
jgi:hypothetical protein